MHNVIKVSARRSQLVPPTAPQPALALDHNAPLRILARAECRIGNLTVASGTAFELRLDRRWVISLGSDSPSSQHPLSLVMWADLQNAYATGAIVACAPWEKRSVERAIFGRASEA